VSDSVQIITLGCPKNEVDSEVIGNILSESGFSVNTDGSDRDAVLINTCGFINDAIKESIDQIREAIASKREGAIKNVYVAGCLVKRYEKELKEAFKDVDLFFSVTDFDSIAGTFHASCMYNDRYPRMRLSYPHYAYLKISEGCDYQCSFCCIPSIRGPLKSRDQTSLLEEARSLVDGGVRELIVIAEDTTRYGKDLHNDHDICTLLTELDKIPDLHWMRLMYAYPGGISERLIDVIKSSRTLCKYIDMPIQHISDSVLERMNRSYRRRHVETLIEKIRLNIPGITLRSTVITGFPGETKKQFIELSDFLSDVEFERLGVFQYSDEEGTEAYLLDNKINTEEITERYEEIRFNQDSISENKNNRRIGSVVEVLVDEIDENSGNCIGRTEGDAPEIDMVARIDHPAVRGQFVSATVKDCTAFELICY